MCAFEGHYTEVKSFIEDRASGIANFEVEYVRGQQPQLVLSADPLDEPEVLSITSWKVDQIDDFLHAKLRQ